MNLNQITIPSIDVTKATVFYKTLGLVLIVDSLPRYVRFQCPDGDATVSIHKVDALPQGEGVCIYFETENLDKVVNSLQEKGFLFTSKPEDKPWLWREAHLKDLDGNQIILYKAGENRKNPPWRIKN